MATVSSSAAPFERVSAEVLGMVLRFHRLLAKLPQTKVAERSGLKQSTISEMESGLALHHDNVVAYAQALGVKLSELYRVGEWLLSADPDPSELTKDGATQAALRKLLDTYRGGYPHLEYRTGSRKRQMYVRGRNLQASTIARAILAGHAGVEEQMADYDLTRGVVEECLRYYRQNEAEVLADIEAARKAAARAGGRVG